MEVIGLLQKKKQCLRRFLEITERFLGEAQQGDFSQLDRFESERDTLLGMIGAIDRRITDCVREIPTEARTPSLSNAVKAALADEAFLVQAIISADGRIGACIERAQKEVTEEIIAARKSQQIAGRFKSAWMPESGEGLDEKA